MARLVTSGFEYGPSAVGSPDGSSSLTGSATITRDASIFRSGAAAAKLTWTASATDSAQLQWSFTGADDRTFFTRLYFYLTANPTGSAMPLIGFGGLGGLQIDTTGVFYVNGTLGSTTITLNTWHCAEVTWVCSSTAGSDAFTYKLDGNTEVTKTGSLLTGAPATLTIGAGIGLGLNTSLYLDDLALNDNQGANENTAPSTTGKIVLLKPISDSAIGTGWTLGTGTAISANSGSTAVKNTPPVGVADLTAGSDTKQIRNASSNANVNYDANLTTYTTAGVGASDTVNVLVPMVATGAPVVTSAKAGTFGVSTNPAITNVSLGAGGTAGAFWSGVAAGTYPTGWKWSFGTTTYAPTVTLGSSPVARITQVTASTRIADVCAMGMYVDYTPAVVATPPRTSTVVLQAVNRSAVW